MKLYHTNTSPYARKVKIVLKEIGKTDIVDYEFCHPFEDYGDLHEKNPLGKIPVLDLGQGKSIYESMLICEYLDDKYNAGKLFSYFNTVEKKMQLHLVHSVLDSSIGVVLESRRPSEKQMKSKFDYFIEAIKRSLTQIEEDFEQNVAGELNIYSISLLVSLGYLDFRVLPFYNWKEDFKTLNKWFNKAQELKSFNETKPPKS